MPTTTAPTIDAEGSLLNAVGDDSLSGVAVVVCRDDGATGCVLDTALSAVTDVDGSFQIPDVPDGTHAVLYSLPGEVRQDWDGMRCSLTPGGVTVDSNTGIHVPGGGATREAIVAFLGVDDLEAPFVSQSFDAEGVTGISGYLYSPSLDLGFIWLMDAPVSVEVTEGGGSIHLRVWDRESIPSDVDPIVGA